MAAFSDSYAFSSILGRRLIAPLVAWIEPQTPFTKSHMSSMAIAILTSLTVLTTPTQALDVQIIPDTPQLGDTLSVRVQTETAGIEPPVVVINQQTYPTFPMGNNRYRALLPTTPLDQPGRVEINVMGGGETRNLAVWLRDRTFPVQRITLPPGPASIQGTDHEFDQIAAFKEIVTPERFWNGPFLRPSQGQVSTVYGVRRYYNGEFAHHYYHRGVDYAAPQGSPVVTPAAGRVVLVGLESQGFRLHGNTIGIDHGQGVSSIFLHLSRIDVQEGDFVQAGQRIGAIGSTGISTGPHLHWGLYVHGLSVDPVPWRYDGIE
jgi:murein DD-endopeptidase MepM/ murein hydrolase activator NlpD